jgi:hypothetical protein
MLERGNRIAFCETSYYRMNYEDHLEKYALSFGDNLVYKSPGLVFDF